MNSALEGSLSKGGFERLAGLHELAFLEVDQPGLMIDVLVVGIKRKGFFEKLPGVLERLLGDMHIGSLQDTP